MAPDPAVLLIVQTLGLAAGAVPVYLLARHWMGDVRLALLFALSYLAYFPLRRLNLVNFHPEAFNVPLLLLAVWALAVGRRALFAAALGVALLTKEETALLVPMFGLYLWLRHRQPGWGLALLVGGVALIGLELLVLIPAFRGEPYGYVARYGHLGESLGAVVGTVLGDPLRVLRQHLTWDRVVALVRAFGPVGFLSALAPTELLLALPNLVGNLLSCYPPQYRLHEPYTTTLTPFVFASGIAGARRALTWLASRWSPKAAVRGVAALIMIGSAAFFWRLPVSDLREVLADRASGEARRQAVAQVPPGASVVASPHLVPHLTRRFLIYPLDQHTELRQAHYILVDAGRPTWPLSEAEHAELTTRLRGHPSYEIMSERGGLLVIRHVAPEPFSPAWLTDEGQRQRLRAVGTPAIRFEGCPGRVYLPYQRTGPPRAGQR
ncbi:MAG: DUF2079 domain-containing protein [Deltaproteobacteria bacterium]|nr:DUF2079 domain-containing protein [Deltaproteobacteria bacterium]